MAAASAAAIVDSTCRLAWLHPSSRFSHLPLIVTPRFIIATNPRSRSSSSRCSSSSSSSGGGGGGGSSSGSSSSGGSHLFGVRQAFNPLSHHTTNPCSIGRPFGRARLLCATPASSSLRFVSSGGPRYESSQRPHSALSSNGTEEGEELGDERPARELVREGEVEQYEKPDSGVRRQSKRARFGDSLSGLRQKLAEKRRAGGELLTNVRARLETKEQQSAVEGTHTAALGRGAVPGSTEALQESALVGDEVQGGVSSGIAEGGVEGEGAEEEGRGEGLGGVATEREENGAAAESLGTSQVGRSQNGVRQDQTSQTSQMDKGDGGGSVRSKRAAVAAAVRRAAGLVGQAPERVRRAVGAVGQAPQVLGKTADAVFELGQRTGQRVKGRLAVVASRNAGQQLSQLPSAVFELGQRTGQRIKGRLAEQNQVELDDSPRPAADTATRKAGQQLGQQLSQLPTAVFDLGQRTGQQVKGGLAGAAETLASAAAATPQQTRALRKAAATAASLSLFATAATAAAAAARGGLMVGGAGGGSAALARQLARRRYGVAGGGGGAAAVVVVGADGYATTTVVTAGGGDACAGDCMGGDCNGGENGVAREGSGDYSGGKRGGKAGGVSIEGRDGRMEGPTDPFRSFQEGGPPWMTTDEGAGREEGVVEERVAVKEEEREKGMEAKEEEGKRGFGLHQLQQWWASVLAACATALKEMVGKQLAGGGIAHAARWFGSVVAALVLLVALLAAAAAARGHQGAWQRREVWVRAVLIEQGGVLQDDAMTQGQLVSWTGGLSRQQEQHPGQHEEQHEEHGEQRWWRLKSGRRRRRGGANWVASSSSSNSRSSSSSGEAYLLKERMSRHRAWEGGREGVRAVSGATTEAKEVKRGREEARMARERRREIDREMKEKEREREREKEREREREREEVEYEIWLQGVWDEAVARGISEATVREALEGLQPLPAVVAKAKGAAEVVLTSRQYVDRMVSVARVLEGKQAMEAHRKLLAEIEEIYGVPPNVMTALWGIESSYGKNMGKWDAIQALLTLAYRTQQPRRAAFFREELMEALSILDNNQGPPIALHSHLKEEGGADKAGSAAGELTTTTRATRRVRLQGSYAGAMGQCQFHAVVLPGVCCGPRRDGRKDIWTSVPTCWHQWPTTSSATDGDQESRGR
ncbi:hypothetical protein CLOM_g13133 [Closterium sp. NIES-68]|nr:hypothetical protein CLOM_g13133 [Closterium sp. NIES-68]